ncbi:MAG: AAA family ATPase [Candidatus Eiseniibacteriota bacterium]
MYLTYFGFSRAPFELVPDPDFLFLGESHEAALANLAMGLEAGKGFVVIVGPVGAGKTTVLRTMLRRIRREHDVCFLTQPEADVRDLLKAVLDGFGERPGTEDLADLRRALRDRLTAGAQSGILIVDEAHLLGEDALEQLRLLSNLEDDHRKLLQIVLSGQRELKELLAKPRLRPLAQRIEMFYEIEPLAAAETHAYIERRLRIAGSPERVRFEPRAVDAIHAITGGVPRLINILADRALVTAYVEDARSITDSTVRDAWEDLGEVTQSVMPGAPSGKKRPRLVNAEALPPPPPLPSRPRPVASPRATAPRAVTRLAEPAPTHAPEQKRRSASRWIAGVGIALVVLLAVGSLLSGVGGLPGALAVGGRPEPPPAPPVAVESKTDPEPALDAVSAPPVLQEARSTVADSAPAGPIAVQVASFRGLEKAQQCARDVERTTGELVRVSPTEVETGLWYRVLVGECETHEELGDLMDRLRTSGGFSFLRPVPLHAAAAEELDPATGE